MPDTGAPWNIPYVAGTDLVADWPTDSQTLAEAIADGLDAAGSVKQFVVATDTTARTTTSSSLTSATISVTITPELTDSEVFVFWTGSATALRTGGATTIRAKLGIDDGSGPMEGAEVLDFGSVSGSVTNPQMTVPFTLLGRHQVTGAGALTFTGQFGVGTTSTTIELQNDDSTGLMVALEIK